MTEWSSPRVLVVDDEQFIRLTVRSMLRAAGRFFVEEAGDGTAALAKVATFRPHLVLCDIRMHPMGGIEFVGALRNHIDLERRVTPVIMLTADADEATVVSATGLQLDGYLLKPVSVMQLSSLVRSVLKLPQ